MSLRVGRLRIIIPRSFVTTTPLRSRKMSSASVVPIAAAADKSYDEALRRLAQLQSNRAITSLFAAEPQPPHQKEGDKNGGNNNKKKTEDLNALAIPEMLAWLARAGYTPSSLAGTPLRCVHVAGTKGKGSVTALVAGILRGYHHFSSDDDNDGNNRQGGEGKRIIQGRVGTYTSPHLLTPRERITVDGRPLSRPLFARYFFEIWDRFTAAAIAAGDLTPDPDGPSTKPFYFRFLTILALHVFVSEGVRSAVVECGIGGEYDATNILPKEMVTASVVTQLGIDHVAMLGRTVEEIAWHKAGIFKEGVKGFTRLVEEQQPGVMKVLRDRAAEKGAAELVEVPDETVASWPGVEGAKLEGPFQKYNMALAVAAAREHLLRLGVTFEGPFGDRRRDGYFFSLDDIPDEFTAGLREASLRGRCETLRDSEGIRWFLDGAHTEDSLAGVGEWFASKATTTTTTPATTATSGAGEEEEENTVRVLLFNQQDRDPAVLLKALLAGAGGPGRRRRVFTHAIFTRNEEKKNTTAESGGESEAPRDLSVQNKARDAFLTLTGYDGGGGGDESAIPTSVHDSVQSAVEEIRLLATATGAAPAPAPIEPAENEGGNKASRCIMVLATGSFHLVGAVLRVIGDDDEY